MTPAAPVAIAATELARRERLILLGSAASATILAWLLLGASVRAPLAGRAFDSAHAPAVGFHEFMLVVLMWQTMMIAMMTPTVVRWLLVFGGVLNDAAPGRTTLLSVSAFAIGYFLVWLAYSFVCGAAQVLLQRSALLDVHRGMSAWLGGAVFVGAGVFQATPIKRACLRHCRSPLGYLLTRWRNGPMGGLRLGFGHGLYCVGCCWALMLVSFALGVMNLLWMAALTIILCVEQLAPHGDRIGRALGVAMAAWGLVVMCWT